MSIFYEYYRESDPNPHQGYVNGDYVVCNYLPCKFEAGPFDNLVDAEEAISEHEDEMADLLCLG